VFLQILLLSVFVIGLAVTFAYCFVTGISPVSSTWRSRRAILRHVPRHQEGTIYELGAGWGALAFPLARRCPKARVVAYELSPVPWLFMWIRRFLLGPRNLELVRRDFLRKDLSDAAFIVCYLHPQVLAPLAEKLDRELSPGATVISNTFDLPAWTPTLVEALEDLMCPEVFIYKAGPALQQIQDVASQLLDYLG